MTQPLNASCCLCPEPFDHPNEVFRSGEHTFHFDCSFDFNLDPTGAELRCSHNLEDRQVEVLDPAAAGDPEVEESDEEMGPLACILGCSALGVIALAVKLVFEAYSAGFASYPSDSL